MENEFNYIGGWGLYLLAGLAFYLVLHRLTTTQSPSWWSYSIRALFIALMLTPWYASPEGDTLAPALMVATLDLVTVDVAAAGRALLPLAIAVVVALIASTVAVLIRKKR